MTISRAYEEVIDFIAAGTTPDNIIAFRPSEETKQRVADLIHREKTTGITQDETSELNHYMQLEHLMRLAKARARKYISVKQS
jgi:GTP-dependent phosphoenolpyruvate carboxykinase